MAWDYVSKEQRGRVAVLRYDRGDGVNALSTQAMRELTEAARSFADDTETSAVILVGATNFSLGLDLNEAKATLDEKPGLAKLRRRARIGNDLCAAWEGMEPVTIAAVEGWAVGGGAVLALTCDLRVMGAGATLYVPEVERAMNLSWGSVPRLVALVGPARAKRIMILAEKLSAEKAEAWGLADAVAPDGGALAAALEMAGTIAAMPPVQVRMIKTQINAAAHALSAAVSALDRDQFALSQLSEDHAESLAAFFEKRAPTYTGR
jgi:enoyl-CoA hydratase/carnithine racemase